MSRPKLNTLEQEWEEFAANIFKNFAPSQVQFDETKKVFFAGAYSMLLIAEKVGNPTITEEQAFEYLSSLKSEFELFAQKIVREDVERN